MKNIFVIVMLLLSISSFAQERCFQCERDSLRALLRKATNDDQKIELLKKIIGTHLSSQLNDFDTTKQELNQLVRIGESKNVKDIDAYRAWKNGYEAQKKRDFKTSLEQYKIAIDLFDQQHLPIPCIIGHQRNIFIELHSQEEKFEFYTAKVKQYQLSGPPENLAAAYHGLANYYNMNAMYSLAISNYLKAGDICRKHLPNVYGNELNVVAGVYYAWGNLDRMAFYLDEAAKSAKERRDTIYFRAAAFAQAELALQQRNFSKALRLIDSAFRGQRTNMLPAVRSRGLIMRAFSLLGLKRDEDAFAHLIKAQHLVDSMKINFNTASGPVEVDYGFYQYYMARQNFSLAEKSLLQALQKASASESNDQQLNYFDELAHFYANRKEYEKAYSYNSKFISLTHALDSANSRFKISPYEYERKELQQLDSIHALKQKQAVQAATIKQNNIMLWISLAAILIISASLSFVYKQYRTNKKTLQTLQNTQQQLVLAEKMASLGELTAGIAHEIQNPLNFVNNFSEVNKELLQEMNDEINKGNLEEVKAIARDVIENQEKINHHGKRADSIVKSMLQHSRKSTGQKELIDINQMCEEYLRLAYHGLRAKDKSFNAKFETTLDPAVGKLNIVAQDVGRVLLNLINNAFYAVSEKKNSNTVSNYEPEVRIGTKKINSGVVITVSDNGTGIKQEVIDKIFQPFFTTKPTGLGTGLGLSLSYDIVKAHGGEIKVESTVGEGTKFIIQLPSVVG